MVRRQIYLTEAEQQALQDMSRSTGRSQSELIREAVDRYLVAGTGQGDRRALLEHGRGLWRHRTDLPDFTALRQEFDQYRWMHETRCGIRSDSKSPRQFEESDWA